MESLTTALSGLDIEHFNAQAKFNALHRRYRRLPQHVRDSPAIDYAYQLTASTTLGEDVEPENTVIGITLQAVKEIAEDIRPPSAGGGSDCSAEIIAELLSQVIPLLQKLREAVEAHELLVQ